MDLRICKSQSRERLDNVSAFSLSGFQEAVAHRCVEKKVPDLHHRSRRTAAWHGVFNDTTADRHFVSAVLKRGPTPNRQV